MDFFYIGDGCYTDMELEKIVANNLAELRKSKKMTQLELAGKINYSDKSVSKWERGDSLPDLKTLCQLADLFEVTLDYFVTENATAQIKVFSAPKERRGYRTIISLLALTVIWGIITIAFVYAFVYLDENHWPWFVWGVPLSAISQWLLNHKWKTRKWDAVLHSVFCWGLLAAVYLQFLSYNIWAIFFIGIPVQVIVILWEILKTKY